MITIIVVANAKMFVDANHAKKIVDDWKYFNLWISSDSRATHLRIYLLKFWFIVNIDNFDIYRSLICVSFTTLRVYAKNLKMIDDEKKKTKKNLLFKYSWTIISWQRSRHRRRDNKISFRFRRRDSLNNIRKINNNNNNHVIAFQNANNVEKLLKFWIWNFFFGKKMKLFVCLNFRDAFIIFDDDVFTQKKFFLFFFTEFRIFLSRVLQCFFLKCNVFDIEKLTHRKKNNCKNRHQELSFMRRSRQFIK